MGKKDDKKKGVRDDKFSRREFFIKGGSLVAGGIVTTYHAKDLLAAGTSSSEEYPKAKGHVEHDGTLCSGCLSCMIACSLAHEGRVSLSTSRIQISRYVFDDFPNDIMGFTCQQCDDPKCVENCPTGACHVDTENGNVRIIDKDKCVGCKTCFESCIYTPRRPVWDSENEKALKCDLCTNAPYNNKNEPACVAICPQKALKFIS